MKTKTRLGLERLIAVAIICALGYFGFNVPLETVVPIVDEVQIWKDLPLSPVYPQYA